MFSIKFFKDNDQHVVSAPHYSIYKYDDGQVGVTTYKDHLDTNGVERIVSSDDFNVCFIENAAGKTIDRIKIKSA